AGVQPLRPVLQGGAAARRGRPAPLLRGPDRRVLPARPGLVTARRREKTASPAGPSILRGRLQGLGPSVRGRTSAPGVRAARLHEGRGTAHEALITSVARGRRGRGAAGAGGRPGQDRPGHPEGARLPGEAPVLPGGPRPGGEGPGLARTGRGDAV